MNSVLDNVTILNEEPLIILFKEFKETTIDFVNSSFDEIEKAADERHFNLICDLSEANPPKAEIRHELKNRFARIDNQLNSVNLFIGNNVLIKIAAQFVFTVLIKTKSTTIHKSIDAAVADIKKKNDPR